jgi:hypothetical protein
MIAHLADKGVLSGAWLQMVEEPAAFTACRAMYQQYKNNRQQQGQAQARQQQPSQQQQQQITPSPSGDMNSMQERSQTVLLHSPSYTRVEVCLVG